MLLSDRAALFNKVKKYFSVGNSIDNVYIVWDKTLRKILLIYIYELEEETEIIVFALDYKPLERIWL